MSQAGNKNKMLTSPAKAEQIIEYCRQKFINILPNTSTKALPPSNKSSSTHPAEISSLNNIIYKKQEVKQVMRQLSIFLQLVIQNCLLSSDTRIKAESYRILGSFRNYLSRDLDEFETMIYNRNKSKLPFYQVDCRDFMPRSIDLKIPPQVSLYQDPLLFYIYTRFAQEELFINHPIHVNRQERIQILKRHVPFLDPLFIPILSERLETKAKFSQLQDRLLLILTKSKLDVSEYKSIYFPTRNQSQIKNRIKNLCGNSKQINNPIKDIRQNQYIPLTEQQIQTVFRGFIKFGTRWAIIAKYYDCRSSEFLEAQYSMDSKLIKRRQKQNIKQSYQSLKSILQKKMQEMNKKKHMNEPMDLENSFVQPQAIDQQRNQENNLFDNFDDQIEEQPQYKIINHLTFQYCQI